jgi:hypothetical protein
VAKRKTPAFWGRYIRCVSPTDSNVLTTTERDFLFSKGCAILPIYNRTVYQRNGSAWSGTFADGVTDALDALAAAATLEIAPGVVIYADIEPNWVNVSSQWVLGWWCTFYPSPYWGGLYCTLQQKYCNALTAAQSMQPPPNMSFIDVIRWRAMPDIRTVSCVWSFNPRRGGFTSPPGWAPLAPPCHREGVKIWQYCANQWVDGVYVDADLATPDALSCMWQAPGLWQS